MVKYHLTPKSKNGKTGPIPVSTSPKSTCPDACPLKATAEHVNGCFGDGGPLALHWRKVSCGERGVSINEFREAIESFPEGQLWRHNQTGDLPGENNSIDLSDFCTIVAANKLAGARGFTYTHKPVLVSDFGGYGYYPTLTHNQDLIRISNANGFTVNLSANNLQHADELADLDIGPVAVMIPENAPQRMKTPAGRPVWRCPASNEESKITCETCGVCAIADRKVIVGLPLHGTSKKRAAENLLISQSLCEKEYKNTVR